MSDASPDALARDSSPTRDELAARIAALERALTDADDPPSRTTPTDTAVEARLDRLAARLDDLDAAMLAVRGYVGQVRHVNREVERTAETALATAERAAEHPEAEATPVAPLRAPNGDPVRATDLGVEQTEDPSDRHDDTPDDGSLLARIRGAL